MGQSTEYSLIKTRLEERDGGTWVSGLCSFCWERLAFAAPPKNTTAYVRCPNGHALKIGDTQSEGKELEHPR